jgi:hypothetical protein
MELMPLASRRFTTYSCVKSRHLQRRGHAKVIVPTETMRVWEYLAMVDGDASPQQIKAAIFKKYRNRVELERISALRRLWWFECNGREAPALTSGKSSVAANRNRKGKAKKLTSFIRKFAKK